MLNGFTSWARRYDHLAVFTDALGRRINQAQGLDALGFFSILQKAESPPRDGIADRVDRQSDKIGRLHDGDRRLDACRRPAQFGGSRYPSLQLLDFYGGRWGCRSMVPCKPNLTKPHRFYYYMTRKLYFD